ncbi:MULTISPECIES: hypothetical protein [unclassified Brevundimonas]|uniref:hypothetical protein n=1 Tax=unclassified Brevundimonas TaxID=2622653 RepID=UPI0006F81C0F|nr:MULTISPECIES: hypothetical protein [unclassified Brevundimonas]KQY95556.1 hypothetical protein ASD25_16180 [Brevundimonas sp. Root1423]KRA28287.1 hypothetical protein ASD59_00150 [Brevundimonas sp. Root608]
MRRTVLALATLALLIGGCQQPAATPEAEPAAVDAAPPEMPADAPPQEEVPVQTAATGEPGSCLAEVGAEVSARLVQRCIAVSPATHPPCNAANPCAMIQGEIDRSCEMYAPGEAKPAECAA